MDQKRAVPPPPPSPGSNLRKEQKFMYVDSFGSTCALNDYISEGWTVVSTVAAGLFALVLIERTTRKEGTHE